MIRNRFRSYFTHSVKDVVQERTRDIVMMMSPFDSETITIKRKVITGHDAERTIRRMSIFIFISAKKDKTYNNEEFDPGSG